MQSWWGKVDEETQATAEFGRALTQQVLTTELLLALDRLFDVRVELVPDQLGHAILASELAAFSGPMLSICIISTSVGMEVSITVPT